MSKAFENLAFIEEHFVEIKEHPQVIIDMRYATSRNFMNENIYGNFHRFFLAPLAAQKFLQACKFLQESHPHLKFKIWDSLRPQSVQQKFWNFLEGTPYQNYVANPCPGSLHNFGMALDLTLVDLHHQELDMGTDFDDFRPLAQPQLEEEHVLQGVLSQAQRQNRLILRKVMTSAGFLVLPHEWWHFNALAKEEVYDHFVLLQK